MLKRWCWWFSGGAVGLGVVQMLKRKVFFIPHFCPENPSTKIRHVRNLSGLSKRSFFSDSICKCHTKCRNHKITMHYVINQKLLSSPPIFWTMDMTWLASQLTWRLSTEKMAVLHRALFTWFITLITLILIVLRLDQRVRYPSADLPPGIRLIKTYLRILMNYLPVC